MGRKKFHLSWMLLDIRAYEVVLDKLRVMDKEKKQLSWDRFRASRAVRAGRDDAPSRASRQCSRVLGARKLT